MSIIFQKLKSLTGRSSVDNNKNRESRMYKSQNVYTFRRMIFSPRGAMLIFATVAGFTIISYYGLFFLKSHLDTSSNKAIIIQQSQQNGNPDTMMNTDLDDIDPGTGLPFDPEAIAQNNPDGLPPEPVTTFKVPQYFLDRTKNNSDVDTPLDNGHKMPEAAEKKIAFEHLPSLPVVNHFSEDKDLPETRPISSDSAHDSLKNLRHVAKNKKNKEVSRMVSLSAAFEDAVAKNDTARADQVLEELFKEEAPNQPYILKLMAYRQIQKQNYEKAKQYLQTILAKDKTDFEAGVNMAIIEIRQQEFFQAKKRLIELREWYPSREIVDHLLDQL